MAVATIEQVDARVIAQQLRGTVKSVPGAVFSVRINRQWAKTKVNPHTVITVEGMVKLWGDDYTPERQLEYTDMLDELMHNMAVEHQLCILPNKAFGRYMFCQQH